MQCTVHSNKSERYKFSILQKFLHSKKKWLKFEWTLKIILWKVNLKGFIKSFFIQVYTTVFIYGFVKFIFVNSPLIFIIFCIYLFIHERVYFKETKLIFIWIYLCSLCYYVITFGFGKLIVVRKKTYFL